MSELHINYNDISKPVQNCDSGFRVSATLSDNEVVSAPKVISRRCFLLGCFFTTVTLMAGCGNEQPEQEEKQGSSAFKYIQREIKDNPNLPSLYGYSPEKQRNYLLAMYTLFLERTGIQGIDAENLFKASDIYDHIRVQEILDRPSLDNAAVSQPLRASSIVAKVFGVDGKSNQLRILYNADSLFLQKSSSRTVLEAWLTAGLHEPFHFITPVRNIDLQYTSITGTNFNYSKAWGMTLYGANSRGESVANFGTTDEMTVYWLQRQLFADIMPEFRSQVSTELQDISIQLFYKLGIKNIGDLIHLRDNGGTGKLIDILASRLEGDKDLAFQKMVTFDTFLFNATRGDLKAQKQLEQFIRDEVPS